MNGSSPRCRQLVVSILTTVLPSLPPEEVERFTVLGMQTVSSPSPSLSRPPHRPDTVCVPEAVSWDSKSTNMSKTTSFTSSEDLARSPPPQSLHSRSLSASLSASPSVSTSSSPNRRRIAPDSIVRNLLDKVLRAVDIRSLPAADADRVNDRLNGRLNGLLKNDSKKESASATALTALSDSLTVQSHGWGADRLQRADEAIHLLHALMASRLWVEIVVRILTDMTRNGSRRLELVCSSVCPESAAQLDCDETVESVISAAAAATVLSGLGMFRCGARVTTNSGRPGIIVSTSLHSPTASVLFQDSTDLKTGKYAVLESLETFPLTSLRVQLTGPVHTDLSSLSQPLLPQIMTLLKQSLVILRNRHLYQSKPRYCRFKSVLTQC